MAFTVPPAKNYVNPLVSLPTWYNKAPVEGQRFVPFTIDWGTDGGANMSVMFQIPTAPAPTLSQIVALSVDNSNSGSDVVFYFPDSQQTYTVPAYSPGSVFPVFTGALTFYAVALTGEAGDRTNVQIFNSLPPPFSQARSELQSVVSVAELNATAAINHALVPAGVNGTLENAAVWFTTSGSAGTFELNVYLQHNGGVNLCATGIAGGAGATMFNKVVDWQQIALPFVDGLTLAMLAGGGFPSTGVLSASVLYRTP